jgi:hypothetical protein
MPSAKSLLPLEDVLCRGCEFSFPQNCLFHAQLGKEGPGQTNTLVLSNSNANQSLTPCEAAASASLFSIN